MPGMPSLQTQPGEGEVVCALRTFVAQAACQLDELLQPVKDLLSALRKSNLANKFLESPDSVTVVVNGDTFYLPCWHDLVFQAESLVEKVEAHLVCHLGEDSCFVFYRISLL